MRSSFYTALLVMVLTGYMAGWVDARLLAGQDAPRFMLNDLQGKPVDFTKSGKRLVILYFFDLDSRPSLEGLNSLSKLQQEHKKEVAVFGISVSPPDRISQYIQKNAIAFPMLRDTGQVRDLYHARQIMPVACLIDSGFKVLEYYQGGGSYMESAIHKAVTRELPISARHPGKYDDSPGKSAIPAVTRSKATTVNNTQEQQTRKQPARASDEDKHGNVGKILNDNEW